MTENENITVEEAEELSQVKENPEQPEIIEETVSEQPVKDGKPSFWGKLGANLKERWRKFLVGLKRKPQNIALFVLLVSSVIFMCSLGNYSQATIRYNIDWTGLLIFVNTMFSILTLLLFMNTFPKRGVVLNKKTMKKYNINYIMLALTFVFMALMIFCDIQWFVMVRYQSDFAEEILEVAYDDELRETLNHIIPAFTTIMVHCALVALSGVLLATLPLYKKLILKINTAKVVEGNELKEEIDTEEDV